MSMIIKLLNKFNSWLSYKLWRYELKQRAKRFKNETCKCGKK